MVNSGGGGGVHRGSQLKLTHEVGAVGGGGGYVGGNLATWTSEACETVGCCQGLPPCCFVERETEGRAGAGGVEWWC